MSSWVPSMQAIFGYQALHHEWFPVLMKKVLSATLIQNIFRNKTFDQFSQTMMPSDLNFARCKLTSKNYKSLCLVYTANISETSAVKLTPVHKSFKCKAASQTSWAAALHVQTLVVLSRQCPLSLGSVVWKRFPLASIIDSWKVKQTVRRIKYVSLD